MSDRFGPPAQEGGDATEGSPKPAAAAPDGGEGEALGPPEPLHLELEGAGDTKVTTFTRTHWNDARSFGSAHGASARCSSVPRSLTIAVRRGEAPPRQAMKWPN